MEHQGIELVSIDCSDITARLTFRNGKLSVLSYSHNKGVGDHTFSEWQLRALYETMKRYYGD